jgi:hypothetical protein
MEKDWKKENDDRRNRKRMKTLITESIKREKLGKVQHLVIFEQQRT